MVVKKPNSLNNNLTLLPFGRSNMNAGQWKRPHRFSFDRTLLTFIVIRFRIHVYLGLSFNQYCFPVRKQCPLHSKTNA